MQASVWGKRVKDVAEKSAAEETGQMTPESTSAIPAEAENRGGVMQEGSVENSFVSWCGSH